jgi:hypothetical protein
LTFDRALYFLNNEIPNQSNISSSTYGTMRCLSERRSTVY